MNPQRPLTLRRFAMILTAVVTAVFCGGREAEAVTNPFAVGTVDELSCATTPLLHIAIANNGSVASSQNGKQWTSPTLYVAYFQANGTTLYPVQQAPIPTIAAGSQTTLDIPVARIDKTYTIAIHATDPAGNTLKLLTATIITPRLLCATPGTGGPVAQAPPLKAFAVDAPTGSHFVGTPFFRGQVDLAFDYDQPQQVDGYRLYRTSHGTRTYVSSLAGPTAVRRVFRITKPIAGDCYDVVAVRKSIESTPSTSACLR